MTDSETRGAPGTKRYLGGCLCGTVRYQVTGEVSAPVACHCDMCRRHHGASGTFVGAPREQVAIANEAEILWLASSAKLERGSCRKCGSKLFVREPDGDGIDITFGTLDQAGDLKVIKHIWMAHRGDYENLPEEPCYAVSSFRNGEPLEPLTEFPPVTGAAPTLPLKGRCFCGKVSFELTEQPQDVVICHCAQCRRWHGESGAYCSVPVAALKLQGEENLVRYMASRETLRAFCRHCASCLFWQRVKDGTPAAEIAVSAGALDAPTGLKTVRQIFLTDPADQPGDNAKRNALNWSSAAPF